MMMTPVTMVSIITFPVLKLNRKEDLIVSNVWCWSIVMLDCLHSEESEMTKQQPLVTVYKSLYSVAPYDGSVSQSTTL